MQIIDGFDQDHLKVCIILKRKTVEWDLDNVDYIYTFLKAQIQWFNAKRKERGGYTVYDLYMDLGLKPKRIYAFIGFGPDDEIKCSPYVDDKKIMISFECKFL